MKTIPKLFTCNFFIASIVSVVSNFVLKFSPMSTYSYFVRQTANADFGRIVQERVTTYRSDLTQHYNKELNLLWVCDPPKAYPQ